MKDGLLKVLVVSLVLFVSKGSPAQATPRPNLAAYSAVLMDVVTGKVLLAKNGAERRAPASTTKIITALVAMERGEMNQVITASENASKVDGSSIWLAPGEKHTLEELLYGVLLNSGNDASVAIAEGLAGSEKEFAAWMNEKAKAIGAKDSCFINCNGLPDTGHFSTAYDLALITRYALHNPVFSKIVKTKKKAIEWPGRDYNRLMVNHNKLLWRYEFADGVKTGYTRQAGRCLVASATKNGQRLIAVVLNSKRIYEDSKLLFEYGFNNYQLLTVIQSEQKIGSIQVDEGVNKKVSLLSHRPVTLVIPKGQLDQVKINIEVPSSIPAPVERLQQVGEVEVKIGSKLIEKVPVVTAAGVPKDSLWRRLWNWLKSMI
ncbi:MAG: D-alanyl-D-alanine carboxypeptidase [Firmicutes bacterium]|nr:D-alanyl-D-alanine carboxypeptidase [Bacillota bacterium]